MVGIGKGTFYVPPENPAAEPQEIKPVEKTTRAPRNREESIVIRDGMRYKKIVEFPLADRYIPLGKVEEVKVEEVKTPRLVELPKKEVNPLKQEPKVFKCEQCGFIAKNQGALNLHNKMTKKHGR